VKLQCICVHFAGTKTFWPVYLICLNLDPLTWFFAENVVLVMLIPGHPKDIQPYLGPLVDEFKRYGPDSEGENCEHSSCI
jgi:hypothetical protein